MICEGKQSEVNYFNAAINEINNKLPLEKRLKVKVVGEGKNTTSLVKTAINIIDTVDKNLMKTTYYEKIFVVFDKDNFTNEEFDNAVNMCEKNNFIPLWSNESFDLWILFHFNLLESSIGRKEYIRKIDEEFKKNNLNYRYKKNDKNLYLKLIIYGSLEKAIKNATIQHRKYDFNKLIKPSKCDNCTTCYLFFDEVDNRNLNFK